MSEALGDVVSGGRHRPETLAITTNLELQTGGIADIISSYTLPEGHVSRREARRLTLVPDEIAQDDSGEAMALAPDSAEVEVAEVESLIAESPSQSQGRRLPTSVLNAKIQPRRVTVPNYKVQPLVHPPLTVEPATEEIALEPPVVPRELIGTARKIEGAQPYVPPTEAEVILPEVSRLRRLARGAGDLAYNGVYRLFNGDGTDPARKWGIAIGWPTALGLLAFTIWGLPHFVPHPKDTLPPITSSDSPSGDLAGIPSLGSEPLTTGSNVLPPAPGNTPTSISVSRPTTELTSPRQ